MNKWVAVSAVLLVAVAASAGASVYLAGNTPESAAERAALDFVRNAPTFNFDGVSSTLRSAGVSILKSNPPQYLVSVEFSCTHTGYGDRSGAVVSPAVTPHSAQVTVSSAMAVTSATIDGYWDEVK